VTDAGPVEAAVAAAVTHLELMQEDQGAVALALKISAALDRESNGRTISELSRQLLSTLESLGASPAARRTLMKGVPVAGQANRSDPLDELRAKRAARSNGT
jgi:hypothetical protein